VAALVLGIDPGSRTTGYGLIHSQGQKMQYAHSGIIHCAELDFPQRLGRIFAELSALIAEYRPDCAAIEQVFMHRNADSALKLGQARGAAICAVLQHPMELGEYAPREIKQALVGRGGADKQQVQHMVQTLLGKREFASDDESDALAIAICHAQHLHFSRSSGIASQLLKQRRRR